MGTFILKLFLLLLVSHRGSCFVNFAAENVTTTLLSNLQKINELSFDSSVNKTRSNNVDIVDGDGVALCHIIDMMFHSLWTPSGERIAPDNGISLGATAAIALAVEHLNSGNGVVVPEIDGLNERCNVRFSTEVMDTEASSSATVNQIIAADERQVRRPCAFLGAGFSSVSMVSSTVTGLLGYPQLSWLSTSSKLSDAQQFPLFARMTPPLEAFCRALIDFLYRHLGIRHFALLHTDSSTILEYISAFQTVVDNSFPDMNLYPIPFTGKLKTDAAVQSVLENVKRTEVTYIFSALEWDDMDLLLRGAVEAGIAGNNEYVWIHFRYNKTHLARELDENDPLRLALRGVVQLERLVGVPGTARYDAFASAWGEIGNYEGDVEYLRSMLPQYPDNPLYQPILEPSTFDSVGPFTARIYDSAVLLGLAACKNSPNNFTGAELYESMYDVSFMGATGLVALDSSTKARDLDGSSFRLINVVETDEDGKNTSLTEVDVAIFNGTTWNYTRDIKFGDGTKVIPSDLLAVRENYNFIDGWLRNLGFVLAAVIVGVSFSFSVWTILGKRKNRAILAAQPFFLQLICVGVAMMGLSIIPLAVTDGSIDEDVASMACLAFPWLLALGWCISFSALFSKTMRVNILFHNPSFRRVKVTPLEVVRPMVVLLSSKSQEKAHSSATRLMRSFLSIQRMFLCCLRGPYTRRCTLLVLFYWRIALTDPLKALVSVQAIIFGGISFPWHLQI